MHPHPPSCPHCGAPEQQWMGHEVRGVYDGVLFWSCEACGHAWSRDWTGYGRRQQIADENVATYLAGRTSAEATP